MKQIDPHISICVCTFKRPHLLERLLAKIGTQNTGGLFRYSVVVVDNDDLESGRATVASARQKAEFQINYDVEPERSISLARNRTVRNAKGNLIAFIDDDEFPNDNWLLNHYKTLLESGADGVLGPVKPHFDGAGPRWLVKSGLLERKSLKTGEAIRDSRHTRTGNVLLWKRLFEEEGASFDPAYGRSGGGDAVFFKRLMGKGKRFVWSNDGIVYETVPPERYKRVYYVKRAFTRGMTEAWHSPLFGYSTAKSLLALPLYASILPFTYVFCEPVFMRYLVKMCDHLSKLLTHLGISVVKERQY